MYCRLSQCFAPPYTVCRNASFFALLHFVPPIAGGELFDRIVARSHYSEREARDVVRTIAEAVEYMHGKNIVHR